MKIAFVGKGGSGKTTMTALFIRHLQAQGRNIMAIDADLNMNLAGVLGATIDHDNVLAAPHIADHIRHYLRGENKRIADINKFLPTTPPAAGSNIITRHDDPALDIASVDAGPQTKLLTVGTYDRGGIGQTCYHSHLFVAENMLTHTCTADNFDVVCDMVAGTDAFAYTLHLQFDAIVLVAEPTPESAEVCALYKSLSQECGVEGLVHIIGNKIDDDEDKKFLDEKSGGSIMGYVPSMPSLKKSRQRGAPIATVPAEISALMSTIERKARNPVISEDARFEKLMNLHKVLNDKQWVKLAYGDVMGQIDPQYKIEEQAA